MPKTKFICLTCGITKETEAAYDRHISICKFLSISSKERLRQIDEYEKEPSIREIFHVMISLCEENDNMKKRITRLESNNNHYKKKSIEDYLSSLQIQFKSFTDWVKTITVSDEHFQLLLDQNLTVCLKQILIDTIDNTDPNTLPLKAFLQRPSHFYKFENLKWIQFPTTEFKSLITILSQRIIRKYIEWKTIHKTEIESNITMQELDMQYMSKTIGFGKSIESRIPEIRKVIYDKIKMDMKQFE